MSTETATNGISFREEVMKSAILAKNGVLTLKGSVKTITQRHDAERAALDVPHVQQVLNQIDVKR